MRQEPRARLATAADQAGIVNVINDAYLVEGFFKTSVRTTAAEIADLGARGVFLVAEAASGSLQGCVFLDPTPPVGRLALLSVARHWQGAGVGGLLLARGEALCRDAGCRALEIEVVNHRTELPGYYARRGYVACGTRPFEDPHLTRPSHFIVMRKPLSVVL